MLPNKIYLHRYVCGNTQVRHLARPDWVGLVSTRENIPSSSSSSSNCWQLMPQSYV